MWRVSNSAGIAYIIHVVKASVPTWIPLQDIKLCEVYLLKSEVYNSLYFGQAIAAHFIQLTVLQRRGYKLKCCTRGLDIYWKRGQSRGEFLQQPHFQSQLENLFLTWWEFQWSRKTTWILYFHPGNS